LSYTTATMRHRSPPSMHSSPLLAALASFALAGCQLYFGDERHNDGWSYCGSDGYYTCEGDDCRWVSSWCPDGAGSGAGPGFECNEHTDCAAGCYCGENGLCEEAGFCTQDSDCGDGYTCNESCSSCEPAEDEPDNPCFFDSQCPQGEYCSLDTLRCTASCTCTTDSEAVAQGFGFCDETRTTCLPGSDPTGDCAGEVTCNLGR